MSLIPCTDDCIYQQEGRCTLARAGSGGEPTETKGCVHFLPRLPAQERPASFHAHDRRDGEH